MAPLLDTRYTADRLMGRWRHSPLRLGSVRPCAQPTILGIQIVAGAPWRRSEERVQPVPAVLSEGVAVNVFGIAVVASWISARRAAATDPMETLRAE